MASSPYFWQLLQQLPARSCFLGVLTVIAIPALVKSKARAAVRHREGTRELDRQEMIGGGVG